MLIIYFIVNVAKTQLVLSTPAYVRSNSNMFIVLIHLWNSHTVYNSRLHYINKSKRQCEQTNKLRKSYKKIFLVVELIISNNFNIMNNLESGVFIETE